MCFAGNPFNSRSVWEWQSGYRKTLYKAGYRSQSAHPWKVEDYHKVLAHVQGRLEASKGIDRVVSARDAFAMSIGWHLFTRGKTVLDWHLHQLERGDGMYHMYLRVPAPNETHLA